MNRSPLPAEAFAPHDRVVPVLLERQAARYGERPLFVVGTTQWSYADIVGIAAGFGAALQQAGVRQGDRVALLCSNRAEFIQTFLGCAWIGAVAVPINIASRGAQLHHVLANSGARLWVVESDLLAAVHLDRRDWPRRDDLAGGRETIGQRPRSDAAVSARRRTGSQGVIAPRRYAGDPLHVRNDRTVEGRLLSPRAVLLVGRAQRRAARDRRRATCC